MYLYVKKEEALSKVPEALLEKFGEPYREYMNRTGMFLPSDWEARWRKLGIQLPRSGWLRGIAPVGVFALVLVITIGTGQWLRGHVIDSLQIDDGPERVTVFLAPVSPEAQHAVARLVNYKTLPGSIAYVAPSSWRIPELGFSGAGSRHERGSLSELLHPTTHGNPLEFAEDRLTVLLADAEVAGGNVQGIDRLVRALNIRPIEFVDVNIVSGQIIDRSPAAEGAWAGIPVPTF